MIGLSIDRIVCRVFCSDGIRSCQSETCPDLPKNVYRKIIKYEETSNYLIYNFFSENLENIYMYITEFVI